MLSDDSSAAMSSRSDWERDQTQRALDSLPSLDAKNPHYHGVLTLRMDNYNLRAVRWQAEMFHHAEFVDVAR